MGNDADNSQTGLSLTGSLRSQLASLAGCCKQLGERVAAPDEPLDALALAELVVALDKTTRRLDTLARRLRPGAPDKAG